MYFLTQAAKTELAAKQKTTGKKPIFCTFDFAPKPDYTLSYGDKTLFLQKFDQIKQEYPTVTTKKDYGIGKNPMTELLFTASSGLPLWRFSIL
jgi:cell division protease FtsH